MRIACYLRCSTSDKQTVASQRGEIEAYLTTRSPKRVRWFEDVGHSGGKLDRPAFKKLMDDVRRRRFDILVCYRLDRISRSLFDAVHVLDQLRQNDVRLVTLADGISFDGPYGGLMYALIAGLAELEREAIRERVKAGLRAAKARGVRLGRKAADHRYRGGPPEAGEGADDARDCRGFQHQRQDAAATAEEQRQKPPSSRPIIPPPLPERLRPPTTESTRQNQMSLSPPS